MLPEQILAAWNRSAVDVASWRNMQMGDAKERRVE